MAKYSIKQLEFILSNYWDLKIGYLPFSGGVPTSGKGGRSPYESGSVWVADIDTAIDSLDQKHPGRWLSLCDDIRIAKLSKVVKFLGHWQQAVARYYLLPESERKEDEGRDARIAVKMMARFLNDKALA